MERKRSWTCCQPWWCTSHQDQDPSSHAASRALNGRQRLVRETTCLGASLIVEAAKRMSLAWGDVWERHFINAFIVNANRVSRMFSWRRPC